MNYKVKTKYEDFDFDDPDEAMKFAITACKHSTESATCVIEITEEDDF